MGTEECVDEGDDGSVGEGHEELEEFIEWGPFMPARGSVIHEILLWSLMMAVMMKGTTIYKGRPCMALGFLTEKMKKNLKTVTKHYEDFGY
jgi:hypothetical protein